MADKQLWQVTPVANDVKNDDGVIIGGQTAGTRYAPLTLIASFVHNLWAAFINAITPLKTSFASGDKIPVVNGSTATAMEASKLLELTAQNALAGNVAPAFDPTKPNDAGGYAYYAGEIVANNGATYKFKENHSSGAWNAAEVERYDAGESLKFFLVTDNPEYAYAVIDAEGKFLFGVKRDGSFDWMKGCPHLVKAETEKLQKYIDDLNEDKVDKETGKSLVNAVFAEGVSIKSTPEFIYAVVDSSDSVLFGVQRNGRFFWQKGLSDEISIDLGNKVDKEPGRSLADDGWANAQYRIDNSEFVKCLVDKDGRLLETIDKTGKRNFHSRLGFLGGVDWNESNIRDLEQALKFYGFTGGQGDWSDKSYLSIPLPKLAIVNISGVESLPETKTANKQGVLQFWDLNGNYFKKNITKLNAQGQSTLSYPKKNFSFDMKNEDGSKFVLKIGDWVSQDSYHIKAAYNDYLKAVAFVGYDIYDDIVNTRGQWANAPWKKALIDKTAISSGNGLGYGAEQTMNLRMDTGARNHPLAFPFILYFNSEFYGIYAFQLKKNRDNYHMSKSHKKEIHLDGTINEDTILGGTIDWTAFEIRNPSGLKNMDGTDYDGDDPQEIKAGEVKTYIENLSGVAALLADAESTYGLQSDELKAVYETYYDVDNVIDYMIFIDSTANLDAESGNWQWTTYDGVKWFLNPYDLDQSFGKVAGYVAAHNKPHYAPTRSAIPTYWIVKIDAYKARLDARYAMLRDKGIVSVESYMKKVNDYIQSIGSHFFELETERWNSNGVVLSDGDIKTNAQWEIVVDENGKPVMGQSSTYHSSTSYVADDIVTYGLNAVNGYYTFKCLSPCTGVNPVSKWRFRDSFWRTMKWMEEQFAVVDEVYNYQA